MSKCIQVSIHTNSSVYTGVVSVPPECASAWDQRYHTAALSPCPHHTAATDTAVHSTTEAPPWPHTTTVSQC